MPEVSVLIPLFGTHPAQKNLPLVCAGWLAQDRSCEVVVSVADGNPPGLPADGMLRVIRGDPGCTSPGLLRNLAARHATGTWLYLSDADVRPVGKDFLSRALALGAGGPLAQPWLYRLVGAASLADDYRWLALAGRRCCFLRAGTADGRVTPCADERYVWDGDNLMVVPPGDLLDAAGPNELRWRSPFHWGGLLVERALFNAVGGYCAEYVGYGCEDDDLLAKVALMAKVTVGWRADPTLRCLHFEHGRPYGTPAFAANQATLAHRLSSGPAAMIEADLRAGTGTKARG